MSLFGKRDVPFEPLDYHWRKYFEQNIAWLYHQFPEPNGAPRKIFVPTETDFPIVWDGSEECARQVLRIVAAVMEIPSEEIDLGFIESKIKQVTGGYQPVFLQRAPDATDAAGLYHHKGGHGLYEISVDQDLLTNPDALIATLAHELSHVKLLGQLGLAENDEHLTDLTTVFFGFGVLNANACFQFFKDAGSWGYFNLGYLKQEEWAYALALMAFMRQEDDPEWSRFLTLSVKKDFDRNLQYMLRNEEEIFRFNEGAG